MPEACSQFRSYEGFCLFQILSPGRCPGLHCYGPVGASVVCSARFCRMKPFQKLTELAERAEELEITRLAFAEMKAGEGKPAEQMLAQMRGPLAEKKARL